MANGHDHNHNHEERANELWQKSEELTFIKGMKAGKTVAEVMGQLDLAKAFAKGSEVEGCSDGRILEHRLGAAGNGILLRPKELQRFILTNRGKIKEVKSHDGCGAAKIKFDLMKAAGEALPPGVTTSDQLGIHFSHELAEKLGADYSHTSAVEMSGQVHNERAIYLDGTGKFNPKALSELPAGFMCSGPALGLSPKYQKDELAILAKIALGDHGFGERLTPDSPLYIMVSATNRAQLIGLEIVARKAAEEFQGRVKVDGFVAE
jgi:hypothetical protein